MKFATLWQAPEINPANGKAMTFPILNPINKYGRTFHLSWIGFFVAFLSWFAYPPLLHGTIDKDLNLTTAQVGNSNIVGLAATLLVRFAVGPFCDLYGPKRVMVACLVLGAIPTAFTPFVNSYSGVLAARFFVGILGGTFVPCQMWTTLFFDKHIVGRVNAFAGGWGNSGGGMTYFAMPALVAHLMKDGYSLDRAWKLSFVVGPFVIIMAVAALILAFGDDCPEGKWSNREIATRMSASSDDNSSTSGSVVPTGEKVAEEADPEKNIQGALSPAEIAEAKAEVIKPPHWSNVFSIMFSPYTMLTALPYATTFGTELAVEGILSGFYTTTAKANSKETWTPQLAGNWGAMFGLLNIVTRPLGGYIADKLYGKSENVLAKKYWMLACGFIQGIFFLAIGLSPHISITSLLAANGFLALFMEMGNGANFALVPEINKHHSKYSTT